MRSPGAGGCDFASLNDDRDPKSVLWTAEALPRVIALTALPAGLADPRFRLRHLFFDDIEKAGDHILERRGTVFRLYFDEANVEPPAVLLPFDRLFDIRAAEAIRLWRALNGGNPGPNPAALSAARVDRLILALRALDGRLAEATYREIAIALFGIERVSERDWISHDLRDKTARLVRLGLAMMNGGYRRLLLHPYRRRS